ncbi:hypothetical protein MTYP_00839 [Methylophilaceae bacterium]|nr:hypothetical protein MTYP_00839 [Methylophilaceae bacterium]
MPLLKINIGSNFLGAAYLIFLQFALLPIILRAVGTEAYGLIGVFTILVTLFGLLDMGMSPALSRELSRLSAQPDAGRAMQLTVSTLEILAGTIAILIGTVLFFASDFFSMNWLGNSKIPQSIVANCLAWMALQSALQFMNSFYNSGLQGLQRIVLLNLLQAVVQTLRAIAVIGLMFLDPPLLNLSLIEKFFALNVLMSLIGLFLTALFLYRTLAAFKPNNFEIDRKSLFQRFSMERLRACWRYAAGMTATTMVVMLLTQLDKVILSNVLSLEAFGIYTIAATVAMAITKPAPLVFSAILPRFTQLVALNDLVQLKATYLKAVLLIAWIILPISGVVILFSEQIFNLYLHGQQDYKKVAELAAILIVGNALHSLTYMPYALSLANGWTRYGLNISIVASIFLVPLIFFSALNFGAIGAAYAWLILNIGYLIFSIRYLHKSLLPEMYSAFYKTIALPGVLFMLFVAIYFLNRGTKF